MSLALYPSRVLSSDLLGFRTYRVTYRNDSTRCNSGTEAALRHKESQRFWMGAFLEEKARLAKFDAFGNHGANPKPAPHKLIQGNS